MRSRSTGTPGRGESVRDWDEDPEGIAWRDEEPEQTPKADIRKRPRDGVKRIRASDRIAHSKEDEQE